jgi:hypothetical protein
MVFFFLETNSKPINCKEKVIQSHALQAQPKKHPHKRNPMSWDSQRAFAVGPHWVMFTTGRAHAKFLHLHHCIQPIIASSTPKIPSANLFFNLTHQIQKSKLLDSSTVL